MLPLAICTALAPDGRPWNLFLVSVTWLTESSITSARSRRSVACDLRRQAGLPRVPRRLHLLGGRPSSGESARSSFGTDGLHRLCIASRFWKRSSWPRPAGRTPSRGAATTRNERRVGGTIRTRRSTLVDPARLLATPRESSFECHSGDRGHKALQEQVIGPSNRILMSTWYQ